MKKLKMDFISSILLNGKPEKKKIDFILSRVREGSILVLDGVLKPKEEMNLIKETMKRVDERFSGIEVCSLRRKSKGLKFFFELLAERGEKLQNFFSKLTGKPETTNMRNGITLIGPAKIIKKIRKNPSSFSVLAEL